MKDEIKTIIFKAIKGVLFDGVLNYIFLSKNREALLPFA